MEVSVVIPVYNRECVLDRALRSVRAQTLPPDEIIVVDDGSTDRSASVAEAAGARVIRQANAGVSSARNRGLECARSTHVAFLDSDDEWLPRHLELLTAQPTPVLTSTAGVTTRGTPLGSLRKTPLQIVSADRLVFPDNPVATSAVLVNRLVALKAGGFDTSLGYGEDLDLWARLLRHGPLTILPEVTVRYWVHPGQVSADRGAMLAGVQRLIKEGLVGERVAEAYTVRTSWDLLRSHQCRLRDLIVFLAPTRTLRLAQLLVHRERGRRFLRGLGEEIARELLEPEMLGAPSFGRRCAQW